MEKQKNAHKNDIVSIKLKEEVKIGSIVLKTTDYNLNKEIDTLNNKIMDGKYHYGRGASVFIQIHNGLLENIDFVGGEYVLGAWDSDDVYMESGIVAATCTDTSVLRNVYFILFMTIVVLTRIA